MRIWRWIKRLVIGFFIFLLTVLLLLQFSSVQTMLSEKVTTYLSEATQTNVTAERLKINPIEGIVLQNFNISEITGDTIAHIGALQISLRKNLFYLFTKEVDLSYLGAKDIQVNILRRLGEGKSNFGQFLAKLSSPKQGGKSGSPYTINLKELELSELHITNDDQNKGKIDKIYLKSGIVTINYLDLICNEYSIQSILLDSPKYKSHIYNEDCDITDELDIPVQPKSNNISQGEPLTITLQELVIDNGRFEKSNALLFTDGLLKDYLDYNNFFFEDINVLVNDFSLRDNTDVSLSLKSLSARDNTGFEIKNIKSDTIIITGNEAEIASYTIEMGNSFIQDRVSFSYASLGDFADFKDKVVINATLKDTKLYLNDLMHFVRSLNKSSFLKTNGKETIELNGRYFGRINNLAGRDVDIKMGNKLSLAGSFNTRDLLDPDNTVLNIRLDKFNTSMRRIKMIFPAFNPPENFYKLGSVTFTGRFDGYIEDFVAYGKLNSDLGSAALDMRLDITQGTNKANYSGTLNLRNFNLGRWSDNQDLGLVNFTSKVVDGRGLTLNTAKADLAASIQSLDFKKYKYKDFNLDGIIDKNTFNGIFKIEDPNLDLIFDGTFEYIDKKAFLNFKSDVKNLDLQALNLSKTPLSFKANMDISLSGSNLNDFLGKLDINDLRMTVKDSIYALDNILIHSRTSIKGGRELNLVSDLGTAYIEGQYDLPFVAKAMKRVIQTNYPYLTKTWSNDTGNQGDAQKFDFNINLNTSSNFLSLIGLDNSYFRRLNLKGRLDTYRNELSIASEVPYLRVGKDSLNELQLLVSSNSTSGAILLHVDSTFAFGRHFNPIDLQTNSVGETINFEFTTVKIIDTLENFDIRGQLTPHEKGYNLTLKDNLLVMLGTTWNIHPKNNIVIGKNYLNLNDMIISDGIRSIEINDINNNQGLSLDINNFNLNVINPLLKYEKMQFAGNMGISMRAQNVFVKENELSGYISVPKFLINGDQYGSIYIDVTKEVNDPIQANISIGDFLAIKATYDLGAKKVDSKIKLREAPLKLLEYLLKDGIKNTGGTIDGDMSLEGHIDSLDVNGTGMVHNGKTTIKYTGASYYFDKQKLKLTRDSIALNGVRIKDQNGNIGTVRGGLLHKMFRSFGVNAIISGNNVVALNTTKADNPDYYGFGVGRVTAEFKGLFDKMDMNITAVTGPGTKLYIPVDNSQLALNQSFIKFVKRNTNNVSTNTKAYNIGGVDVKMAMTITPDAEVSLIFNEARGDIIKGKGRGNLKIDITRQGDFEVFGDYEIEQGEYLFTVALLPVAKPFVVERGGRITWTGDPVNATIDMTAKYRTRTSVEPFIAEYLTLATANDQRLASQNTEVDVQLKLGGTLFKPEIKFNLNFPNLTGDVANFADSKLRILKNNELELNGQVLGLIVFNSFLPSNRVADAFGAAGI
ncbi:MAG: translocation/assembly module TamB domain-containing protein, partial [Saprospiraceae bacterium]